MTVRSIGSPGRLFSVKVEEGENVHQALARLAEDQDIGLAVVSGIGGFSKAVIAYYKPEEATYYTVEVVPSGGFVIEVASLSGNIVRTSKGPSVHLHAVLGVSPEKTISGHLVEGIVKPFLELFVQEVLVGGGEEVSVYSHRESFKASYRPYG